MRYALIWLFLGAFAIGFSPTLVRLSELGPLATGVHRAGLAVPILFLWLGLRAAPRQRSRQSARGYGLLFLAGLFFAGDLAFWHWSIALTSVANATLFATSTPLFVTAGAWLWLGERPTPTFVLALTMGIGGGALLVADSLGFSGARVWGDIFGVVTALFFSAYLVTIKRLRTRFTAVEIMAWTSLVTAATLAPISLIAGEPLLGVSATGWLTLFALALISHALGQGLVAHALDRLPASLSALGLLSEPLFAAAIAWIILAEALAPLQAVGAVLVLAAVFIAYRGNRAAQ